MKRLVFVVLLAAISTASLAVQGAAAPTRVRLVRVTSARVLGRACARALRDRHLPDALPNGAATRCSY
jgi:hypothetical protein